MPMNTKVWERFWALAISAYFSTFLVTMGMIMSQLPWLILLYAVSDDNDWWNIAFFLCLFVGLMARQVLSFKETQICDQNYAKLVSKMQPTVQAEGYTMKYVPPNQLFLFSEGYVRFTPNPPHLPQPSESQEDDDAEDEVSLFQIEDWRPLEGTWVRNNELSRNDLYWIIQMQWATWTYSSTSSDLYPFVAHKQAKGRILYCYPKVMETREVVRGNTLVLEPRLGQESSRLTRIMSKLGVSPVPPLEAGVPTGYYRVGENGIMRVAGPQLLIYNFEFQEDVPCDCDLVAGALDRLPPDGNCGTCVSTFDKQSGGSVLMPTTTVPGDIV
jgi:hypothetical protein